MFFRVSATLTQAVLPLHNSDQQGRGHTTQGIRPSFRKIDIPPNSFSEFRLA